MYELIKRFTLLTIAALLIINQGQTALAANTSVVAINWNRFSAEKPVDPASKRIETILLNTNKHALVTWYGQKGYSSATQQSATYLDFGGIGEHNIRPAASQALALAVSLKTGIYNQQQTTVDSYGATTKTAKLIRSVAYRHKVNLAGGWGDQWQSGLWAAYAGTAGWLMWDTPYMTVNDKENVRQMVEYEANRFIGYRVPYYMNTSGSILTPGDSKAEENAWNAMLLETAMAMMPNHPNYDAWKYKSNELMISSFATPDDVVSSKQIAGRSLANWLYGSNANQDGTLINHFRVHPDYMTTISETNYAALTSSLSGRPTPTAAFHNSEALYKALVDLPFQAGELYPPGPAISSPGGTMYVTDSSNIYYPQGNDWGTDRRMHFVLSDIQASAFGYDQTVSKNGSYWENLHAQRVLDMQSATTDGRSYTTYSQDTYGGREEWVAVHAAQAYLTKWLVHYNAFLKSDTSVPLVIDNLDRESAIQSGSWTVSAPVDRLGQNNLYAPAGTGSSRVRYTPRITTTGNYNVYAWWTAWPNHATNAPYTINHSAGSTTVRTNQEINGGKWNLIGTYNFTAGTTNYVELSNNANEYVVSDAMKFELTP